MIARVTVGAIATLLLAACAGGSSGEQPATAIADPMGAATLSELPTQVLMQGQCALVLWSRNSTPMRIAVTLDQPAVARVNMKGRVVELARVSQNGQSIHGQFPEQHYRGEGMAFEVSFKPEDARELAGGAVVSSAVVEFDDPSGWTSVIPAVGLIACQSQEG
jgi:hypothetical protein